MTTSAVSIAQSFIESFYPGCMLAVLGGSAARNEWNPHSDLDLVILDDHAERPYRKTVKFSGRLIECFVLTPSTYRTMFDAGIHAANPALQRMIAEGTVIRREEAGMNVFTDALDDLSYGPMPWSEDELNRMRYVITEYVEDLKGAGNRSEVIFTANQLAIFICQFVLRVNREWVAEGKHLFGLLLASHPERAGQLERALEALYRTDDREPFIALTMEILDQYGGPLAEGYMETGTVP